MNLLGRMIVRSPTQMADAIRGGVDGCVERGREGVILWFLEYTQVAT